MRQLDERLIEGVGHDVGMRIVDAMPRPFALIFVTEGDGGYGHS